MRPGAFLNESDFVRDAIRHRLAETKVIKCRDVDYETAKKEVTGYFKQAGEAYPDEAAEDLELDFDLVMRITEELRKNRAPRYLVWTIVTLRDRFVFVILVVHGFKLLSYEY